MSHVLKVAAFSLGTVGLFAAYSNYGIPQITPAEPPRQESIEAGGMTTAEYAALGGRIFSGKGSCTLCHNAVGGRAPPLDRAAAVAAERLADPRYAGQAADEAEYLYESMVEPSAYVVAGFGKTGTGDTVSPMPSMKAGATVLADVEIKAVIAFLQTLSGVEVTVEPPAGPGGDGEAETVEDTRSPLGSPEEVIEEFACGTCHIVAGEEGDVGPDLTGIGAIRDREYLRRAILSPDADIAPGFEQGLMPPDYGQQLYAAELEMLVGYLADLE
jgi:mono/diheme cytochrome c family protein